MPNGACDLIDGIRKRPPMYVGDVSERGLHEMTFNVIDLLAAELISGYGTCIVVRICLDGTLAIEDDGRTVPVVPLTEFDGQSRFEIVFTRIEAAATYRGPQRYRVGSGGICGLALAQLNALSQWLVAETSDGAVCSRLRFERGRPIGPIAQEPATWTGLRLRFKPDPDIFQVTDFNSDILVTRLVELAALHAGLPLEFKDERSQQSLPICFADGLTSLVRLMNLDSILSYSKIITISHESDRFRLHVAFQHTEVSGCRAYCYANAMLNSEGGTHWTGFIAGLTRAIEHSSDCPTQNAQLATADLLNGLTAVISIWVDDLAFEGPTKNKFAFAAIHGTVEALVYQQLKALFEREPEIPWAIQSRKLTTFSHPPRWTLADIAALRQNE